MILLVLNGLSIELIAQAAEQLDESRISKPKVLAMLERMELHDTDDFNQLEASCYIPDDAATYSTHEKTFIIEAGLAEVWKAYKFIHPREAWNGQVVSYGLMYSKSEHTLNYLDDAYGGVAAGQILFLNLRLLSGLLNLAVAHEIQEVDESAHTIRFCYLANGKSAGSQELRFQSTNSGFTAVTHLTRYRSSSAFRDKYLYPGFHERVIDDFHANVVQYLFAKDASLKYPEE